MILMKNSEQSTSFQSIAKEIGNKKLCRCQSRPQLQDTQCLTFTLAGELYGIEICQVQEILDLIPITRIPGKPKPLRGVANLRGKIIPILDLRLKMGIDSTPYSFETCTIIVKKNSSEIGVIVDKVAGVAHLEGKNPSTSSMIGENIISKYILGFGTQNENSIILLNIQMIIENFDILHATVCKKLS